MKAVRSLHRRDASTAGHLLPEKSQGLKAGGAAPRARLQRNHAGSTVVGATSSHIKSATQRRRSPPKAHQPGAQNLVATTVATAQQLRTDTNTGRAAEDEQNLTGDILHPVKNLATAARLPGLARLLPINMSVTVVRLRPATNLATTEAKKESRREPDTEQKNTTQTGLTPSTTTRIPTTASSPTRTTTQTPHATLPPHRPDVPGHRDPAS